MAVSTHGVSTPDLKGQSWPESSNGGTSPVFGHAAAENWMKVAGWLLGKLLKVPLKHPSSCLAVRGAGQNAPSFVAVVKIIGKSEAT